MRRPELPLLLVAALLALAGCGGGSDDESAAGGETVAAATTLPECAGAGAPSALPDAFPPDLRLPPGSIVREARDDGTTINVEALVPGDIRSGAEFLLDRLPQAGYELGEGDAEEHEAESHFSGNGFDGFFKLNTIGDCDGANTLALVLTRA